MTLPYSHSIDTAFADVVGEQGADKARFNEILAEANQAVKNLNVHRKDNSWPVLNIAQRQDEIATIHTLGEKIAREFATLIVIGMGGSSLGGKALVALNHNPFLQANGTRVQFVDNIDPTTSQQLLSILDAKSTLFMLVSKSGDTAETLAHTFVLLDAVESKLGAAAIQHHFIAIAGPHDNALRRLATRYSIPVYAHDPNIGGRFAGLTMVGLLPAKVAGIDIDAVREGAALVTKRTFETNGAEPAQGAALGYALNERGKSISVLMPYCDRLGAFSDWHRQLWAESLGKNGHGMTPIRSMGASDQHSQLQLYLGGPRDKFMSLMLLNQQGKGAAIADSGDATLAYLKGHTIGDLMAAEQRATAETLTRNKCPIRVFGLDELDARAIGALMMHFMLETIIMAQLFKVNAFDQPAVEESKELARRYLA